MTTYQQKIIVRTVWILNAIAIGLIGIDEMNGNFDQDASLFVITGLTLALCTWFEFRWDAAEERRERELERLRSSS